MRTKGGNELLFPTAGGQPLMVRTASGMTEVKEARDRAMGLVAANAESRAPGFAALARAFALAYLRERGDSSGEAITDACKAAGVVPHDDRAFGPVYAGLARDGLIERVGHVARRKGHGTAGGNVWRAVGQPGPDAKGGAALCPAS